MTLVHLPLDCMQILRKLVMLDFHFREPSCLLPDYANHEATLTELKVDSHSIYQLSSSLSTLKISVYETSGRCQHKIFSAYVITDKKGLVMNQTLIIAVLNNVLN